MKKVKILSIFSCLFLSFFAHFMYVWFPNSLTALLFPVNESIWEHMKIIYICVIINSLLEVFIYKYKNINYNNFLLSLSISSILGIIVYLILYLPLESLFGHSLFLAIAILFISFIFIQYISYLILTIKQIKNNFIIGIILIIFSYLIFYIFTYNPPKNRLFIDSQTNSYGIKKRRD